MSEQESRKRSEKIFKELEELELTRDGIELRWQQFNEVPVLRDLAHRLLIAECIDPVGAEKLREELAMRLRERDEEKNAYLLKWKELRRSLEMLTRPVISNFILEFSELSGSLGKKKISEIISKSWDGLKGMGMLRIRTNSPSMEEVRKKIAEAIETIQKMHASSIPMIEKKAGELKEQVKGIDFCKTTEKIISEDDFYRFTTPQGVAKDYAGPRTRLDG